jgi:hypothetical protein
VLAEAIIAAFALAAAGFAVAQRQRAALYPGLGRRVAAMAASPARDLTALRHRPSPDFAQRLAIVSDALPANTFAVLRREARTLVDAERSFVPAA